MQGKGAGYEALSQKNSQGPRLKNEQGKGVCLIESGMRSLEESAMRGCCIQEGLHALTALRLVLFDCLVALLAHRQRQRHRNRPLHISDSVTNRCGLPSAHTLANKTGASALIMRTSSSDFMIWAQVTGICADRCVLCRADWVCENGHCTPS